MKQPWYEFFVLKDKMLQQEKKNLYYFDKGKNLVVAVVTTSIDMIW